MKYLIKPTRVSQWKQINVKWHTSGTNIKQKNNEHFLREEYVAKLCTCCYAEIEQHDQKSSLYSTLYIYKMHVYSFLHKILLNRELLRDQTFY